MKRILFISYDGMTDPLGQSQVIPYLAGLTKYGYHFTILSCDKPALFQKNKEIVLQQIAGLPIEWVSIPYHKNPPVLSSVYDYWSLRKKADELHRKNNFQLIHTRPGLPTMVALYMKKKYGIAFLNDVRGFWADERVDGAMWNLKNPVYKILYNFFKKHEYECLEKADAITCLTHAAKKEMLSWDKFPAGKNIEVIPCSVDNDLFDPANIDETVKNNFRNKLNISSSDIIFSYLGSIGGWYLTKEMMQLFKLLADKNGRAKFLFISPQHHEKIIAAADAIGLNRERLIITSAKRSEVPALLSFSHFSVFFIKPCYSKISSSPTKHGEIMAMGIPVVCNSGVGDIAEIVEKYNSGFIVNEFSDKAISGLVEKITSSAPFDVEKIRAAATEYYDLNTAVTAYSKVYKQLFS